MTARVASGNGRRASTLWPAVERLAVGAAMLILLGAVGLEIGGGSPMFEPYVKTFALPVAGLLAVVIGATLVPYDLLLLGLIVTTLVPVTIPRAPVSLWQLAQLVLVAKVILTKFSAGEAEAGKATKQISLFLLGVFSVVSVGAAWHGPQRVTQIEDTALLFATMLCVPPAIRASRRSPEWFSSVLLLVTSAFVVYLRAAGSDVPGAASAQLVLATGQHRLTSAQIPTNALAVLLVLPVLIAQARFLRDRRISPIILLAGLAGGLGLVLTYSRNGLIALALGELILAWMAKGHRVLLAIMTVVAALSLAFFAGTRNEHVLAEAYARGDSFLNTQAGTQVTQSGLNGAFGERVYLWRLGLSVFRAHPVFGTGYGPKRANLPTRAHGLTQDDYIGGSHNSYTTMLAVGGVTGFGLLVALLWQVGSGIRRRLAPWMARDLRRRDLVVLYAMAGWVAVAVISSVFDDILYFNQPFTLLWYVAAAALVASAATAQHERAASPPPLEKGQSLPVAVPVGRLRDSMRLV